MAGREVSIIMDNFSLRLALIRCRDVHLRMVGWRRRRGAGRGREEGQGGREGVESGGGRLKEEGRKWVGRGGGRWKEEEEGWRRRSRRRG